MMHAEPAGSNSYRLVYHPAPAETLRVGVPSDAGNSNLEDIAATLYNTVGVTAAIMRVHGSAPEGFHAVQIFNETHDLCHILFFQLNGGIVRVCNLFLDIHTDVARLFSDFVFRQFPKARWIDISNCTAISGTDLSHMVRSIGSDYFIRPLPATFDDALKSLGQNTNQNFRRYIKKAQKEIQLDISVAAHDDLDQDMFDRIIKLKNAQLARNGIPPIPHSFSNALFEAHQKYGHTVLLRSGDRLIAAYLTTIAGNRCEFWTTAYDAEFSRYWLGNIAGIEAIRNAIANGCTHFNFLWGFTDHKVMLGGQASSFQNMWVARNILNFYLCYMTMFWFNPVNRLIARILARIRVTLRL